MGEVKALTEKQCAARLYESKEAVVKEKFIANSWFGSVSYSYYKTRDKDIVDAIEADKTLVTLRKAEDEVISALRRMSTDGGTLSIANFLKDGSRKTVDEKLTAYNTALSERISFVGKNKASNEASYLNYIKAARKALPEAMERRIKADGADKVSDNFKNANLLMAKAATKEFHTVVLPKIMVKEFVGKKTKDISGESIQKALDTFNAVVKLEKLKTKKENKIGAKLWTRFIEATSKKHGKKFEVELKKLQGPSTDGVKSGTKRRAIRKEQVAANKKAVALFSKTTKQESKTKLAAAQKKLKQNVSDLTKYEKATKTLKAQLFSGKITVNEGGKRVREKVDGVFKQLRKLDSAEKSGWKTSFRDDIRSKEFETQTMDDDFIALVKKYKKMDISKYSEKSKALIEKMRDLVSAARSKQKKISDLEKKQPALKKEVKDLKTKAKASVSVAAQQKVDDRVTELKKLQKLFPKPAK